MLCSPRFSPRFPCNHDAHWMGQVWRRGSTYVYRIGFLSKKCTVHLCWPNMYCRTVPSRLVSQPGKRSLHQSSVRRAIMMPAMSPFMTQGTIRRWAKREGEAFRAGDVLCQIESEYATIDVQAENPGIIGKILKPDGSSNVPVEQVIAIVAKTSQELARLQAPPLPPPPFQHQHHFPSHGAAGLAQAASPMMVSVHRTPLLFDMHDPLHSSGSATVRGMVIDHAGSQHHAAAENDDQATELRKTIVSTLSRRGSGSETFSSNKCTTTEYFSGIL
ncbi:single hybrid motif-containing protein [Mycena crocata]|nr:single hybrid motif-containing protein [Mycena crocata]